jgi:hypothetical protein
MPYEVTGTCESSAVIRFYRSRSQPLANDEERTLVYIFGDVSHNDSAVYDSYSNEWTELPKMIERRSYCAACYWQPTNQIIITVFIFMSPANIL